MKGFLFYLIFTLMSNTIFAQFYNQEGQRTKHGSYDTARHCDNWIAQLQARETKPTGTDDCIEIDRFSSVPLFLRDRSAMPVFP